MKKRTLAAALAACAAALVGQQTAVSGGPGSPGVPVGPPVGAISTFRVMAGELIGGSPVTGAPYSAQAVTESTQTLADGNRIVNTISAAVYRDSQGRERREQSLPNLGALTPQGAPAKNIMISDPVAGVNYSLDPNTKVAMKLPAMKTPDLPTLSANGRQVVVKTLAGPIMRSSVGAAPTGANVMYFQSGSGGNVPTPKTEELGSQIINGVTADGTRTTMTIPAGLIGNDKDMQIVDEVWRSPELQVLVQSTHSDPRMGTTTYSLTNISRSEPSLTLFQVPPDYTIQDSPAKLRAVMPLPLQ
jgi:hypothetical protein